MDKQKKVATAAPQAATVKHGPEMKPSGGVSSLKASTPSTSSTPVEDVEGVDGRPKLPGYTWDMNDGLYTNFDRLGNLLASLPGLEVARRIKDLSPEERLRRWREETSKSQAALYRRLSELGDDIGPE